MRYLVHGLRMLGIDVVGFLRQHRTRDHGNQYSGRRSDSETANAHDCSWTGVTTRAMDAPRTFDANSVPAELFPVPTPGPYPSGGKTMRMRTITSLATVFGSAHC